MSFFWDTAQPPVSLAVDGVSTGGQMSGWVLADRPAVPAAPAAAPERAAAPGLAAVAAPAREHCYRHPASNLCLRALVRHYTDFPAWEWVLELMKDKAH